MGVPLSRPMTARQYGQYRTALRHYNSTSNSTACMHGITALTSSVTISLNAREPSMCTAPLLVGRLHSVRLRSPTRPLTHPASQLHSCARHAPVAASTKDLHIAPHRPTTSLTQGASRRLGPARPSTAGCRLRTAYPPLFHPGCFV